MNCWACSSKRRMHEINIPSSVRTHLLRNRSTHLAHLFFSTLYQCEHFSGKFSYCLPDWRCAKYTKLVSLRNKLQCIHLRTSLLWYKPIERQYEQVWIVGKRWKRSPASRFFTSLLLLRSESPSGMCAKLRTVGASNNRDHRPRSFCYCLFAPHICGVVLRAHSFRGEPRIQRNTSGVVATLPS